MPPKKSNLSRRPAHLRRKDARRLQETEEQRQCRLEYGRARAAARRAAETPEQYQQRLQDVRIRATIRRAAVKKWRRKLPTANRKTAKEQNKPKYPRNTESVNMNSQNVSALSGVFVVPSNLTVSLSPSSPAFPAFPAPPLPNPSEMGTTAVQNEPSLEEEHDPLYIGPEPGMGATAISDLEERLNFEPEVGTAVKLETEVLDSGACVWVTVKSETEEGLDPDFTAS